MKLGSDGRHANARQTVVTVTDRIDDLARALTLRREVARIYLTDSEGVGMDVARDRRGLRDSDKNLPEEWGNLDHWYRGVIRQELRKKDGPGTTKQLEREVSFSKFRELR